MLKLSNMDVLETLKKFQSAKTSGGLDVTFLVPTHTGIKKSIMDATKEVRLFLKKKKIHDFELQAQGTEHKKLIETVVYSKGITTKSICSLYRPETKSGDPRIWFTGLKQLAEPTDLLALIASKSGLVVVNCSNTNLSNLLDENNFNFWNQFDLDLELNERAVELLDMLKTVANKGFIQTLRKGDTGVGFTLETLLGIQANSSKSPDYKGIELKSKRQRNRSSDRTTIFSKVPDWSRSRLKGSKALLLERGYYSEKKGRNQLFHTFSCRGPNSLNMLLNLDDDWLYQDYQLENKKLVHDVQWRLNTLEETLLAKHQETFWIYADTRGKGTNEEFWYRKARYTAGPDPYKLAILLESGAITVDYTITELPSGAAKDQGYLFKIKPDDLELLFEAPVEFSLHE